MEEITYRMSIDASIHKLLRCLYQLRVPRYGIHAMFGTVSVMQIDHLLLEEIRVYITWVIRGPVVNLIWAVPRSGAGQLRVENTNSDVLTSLSVGSGCKEGSHAEEGQLKEC